MSRAKEIQQSEPQDPQDIARIAGKDIYGTSVGMLRRVELWRLGNAWGMEFPIGASKDYMIPFFMRLESEGKNPLRPPGQNLDALVKQRAVVFSDGTHAETQDPFEVVKVQDTITPEPVSDIEEKLQKAHMGQLKKICKMRGLPNHFKDRKKDLVARIVASMKDEKVDENTPERD